MRREGLWPAALNQADVALRQAGPDDQVAIMTFDRRVRTLVGFQQWSAMDAGQRAALALGVIGHKTRLGFDSTWQRVDCRSRGFF